MRNLRNTKIVFEYLVTLIVFTSIAFVIAMAVSVALDKEWDNQLSYTDSYDEQMKEMEADHVY